MKVPFMHELDRIDIRILRTLQAEGRLTNAELASRVHVSAPTCHRRTQRLFEEGYITGVHAQIAPEPVGLGAVVMVGVVLDRSTPESFAAFEDAVLRMEQVLDCNLVAGDFDYLLKIRVRDMADFNRDGWLDLAGRKLETGLVGILWGSAQCILCRSVQCIRWGSEAQESSPEFFAFSAGGQIFRKF